MASKDETGSISENSSAAEHVDVEVDDDALGFVAGGQSLNSTQIVYASTFVPFDSSF